VRFAGGQLGYRLGVEFLDKVQQSGLMDKIMTAASILGCIVIGGMVSAMVATNFAISFGSGESVMTLQNALDSIIPGIAGAGITWLFYWLLGKKVSTVVLLLGTIVVCVLLTGLGIMA